MEFRGFQVLAESTEKALFEKSKRDLKSKMSDFFELIF